MKGALHGAIDANPLGVPDWPLKHVSFYLISSLSGRVSNLQFRGLEFDSCRWGSILIFMTLGRPTVFQEIHLTVKEPDGWRKGSYIYIRLFSPHMVLLTTITSSWSVWFSGFKIVLSLYSVRFEICMWTAIVIPYFNCERQGIPSKNLFSFINMFGTKAAIIYEQLSTPIMMMGSFVSEACKARLAHKAVNF